MATVESLPMLQGYFDFARMRNIDYAATVIPQWQQMFEAGQEKVLALRRILSEMDLHPPYYLCSKPVLLDTKWLTDFGSRTKIAHLSTGLVRYGEKILFDSSGTCVLSPFEIIPPDPVIPPLVGNYRHEAVLTLSESEKPRIVASMVAEIIDSSDRVFAEDTAFMLALCANEPIEKELLDEMTLI